MGEQDTDIATLKVEVKNMSKRIDNVEERCSELAKSIKETDEKWDNRIQEIKDELSKRLPNWATALITIMGSVITGLFVKLAGG